ncbi:ABC transporter permease [Methylocystis sp. JR02]|uniref:ABC transporter permease n=1 Tax=Methylocystis sp. JR02 TaxID=3046284 RepID=UPI0024BB8A27|nr:ABC transporter permease [Methylocystis sp. JR02]MDJ0449936.1 ABC transporter permease [Methylocystis sp. JR02]
MTLQTLFREAINALRLNLLRSALTAFGVIIGVGSLVVMSAANSGANKLVERQIADQGTDALVVRAAKVENALRRGAVVVLTDQDANAVRELVPNIQYLSREVYSKVTLVAGNSSWITEYWGVDASYEQVWGVKLSEGRFFDEAEARSGAKVIVVGATVARKLFGTASPLDQTVRLGTIPVRIIGVRRKRGSFGGVDEDNFIILPIKTARAHIPNSEMSTARQLSLIDMKVSPGANREKVKQDVLALLRERKHLRGAQEDKLDVIDLTQMVQLLNTTQSTLNRLLLATAAILLLVGGVGIMNIMLVSVTERTREIGLRMAIGARRRDILLQFLTEAVTLSVVAGLIGLMIGFAGSVLVARLVDWPLIIPPLGAAAATLVSVGVGIIFGYLPARRGAGLNPIDALRRK